MFREDLEGARRIDAVFFHARAADDDDGLFDLAAELVRSNTVRTVALNSNPDGWQFLNREQIHAWPGAHVYRNRLETLGVLRIYTHPNFQRWDTFACFHQGAWNTKEENDEFLELVADRDWKSAVLIAQMHQLPRAFAGAVQTMADTGHWIRLYAACPGNTDWDKPVCGSPIEGLKPRREHVRAEAERIAKYTAKGDLAPFDIVDEYLSKMRPFLEKVAAAKNR